MAIARGALSGLTVIDLTRVRAGPVAVRQFADWGARVIRVEMPGAGEDGYTGGRTSADFQNLHRNKECMTLDLKSGDGRSIFFELCRRADVLVENYRPDVKRRLGIDYEAVSAINPRIVYGSISGFGQDGPYAGRPGVDQIAQGMGGLMAVTGDRETAPMRAGAAIADMASGLYLALGIFTALMERATSGQGQWVHTSLLEAQIAVMDFQAAAYLVNGTVPEPAGNDHPHTIPTGTFATADGHINIGSGTPSRWFKLCEALDAAALAQKPGFVTPQERSRNRKAVNAALQEIFSTKTSAEWIDKLNSAGIPCGPIYRMDQVFADEQVRHLGIARPMKHPKLGDVALVGEPIHLSRTPWELRSPAPAAGQDNQAILAELGFSGADIERFRSAGVL